jgi:hypothetical protein
LVFSIYSSFFEDLRFYAIIKLCHLTISRASLKAARSPVPAILMLLSLYAWHHVGLNETVKSQSNTALSAMGNPILRKGDAPISLAKSEV